MGQPTRNTMRINSPLSRWDLPYLEKLECLLIRGQMKRGSPVTTAIFCVHAGLRQAAAESTDGLLTATFNLLPPIKVALAMPL